MAHRGRGRRARQIVAAAGDEDEEAEEAAEVEDDDSGLDTSLEDLVSGADPNTFDRTFDVSKDDVPVAVTEAIPIPQPWQGIPRVAMVFNFNYVWNESEERWERDTGNKDVMSFATTRYVDSDNVTFPFDVTDPPAFFVFRNRTTNTQQVNLPQDPADGDVFHVANSANSSDFLRLEAPGVANDFNNGEDSVVGVGAGDAAEVTFDSETTSWLFHDDS